MKSSRTSAHLCIFLVLSAWSLPILSRDLPSTPNVVDQTCEATRFKDLCKSTLTSFPTNVEPNLHDLARRALQHASLQAGQIEHELTQGNNDVSDQCFRECSGCYRDAVVQLDDSVISLDAWRYVDVETWVNAAMDDVGSCVEECNTNSTIAKMNVGFNQLCANALDIVNVVAGY